MWVMTLDGFYSAVEYRDSSDYLLVRCRDEGDATRLAEWHVARYGYSVTVEHTPMADYAWRMTMLRRNWGNYVAESAVNIDYPNFKNAVANRMGKKRAVIYSNVWVELLALQEPK